MIAILKLILQYSPNNQDHYLKGIKSALDLVVGLEVWLPYGL